MKALRSSPLSAFVLASALHFFIFSCWVIGLASSPFKHFDMNALRSSPFMSPACALHAFIRSCCGFGFCSSAAKASEPAPVTNANVTRAARIVLICVSLCRKPGRSRRASADCVVDNQEHDASDNGHDEAVDV